MSTNHETPYKASPKPRPNNYNQHYKNYIVLAFSKMMKKTGYGDWKRQEKKIKDFFDDAVKVAENDRGMKRTAKAWRKQFTRINQEFSFFVTKLKAFGNDGDEDGLNNRPEFFAELHDLEHRTACYDSPKH